MEKKPTIPNNFRDNLAHLRTAYHQSQSYLAGAIGVASGTIGNYECGKNYPEPKILSKIANYYHVSEEQLVHGDYRNLTFEFLPLDDISASQRMFLVQFPLACSDKALKDDYFNQAYTAHQELYRLILDQSSDIPDRIMDDIFQYDNSIYYNSTPEAGINYASFLIFLAYCMSNEHLIEGIAKYQTKQVSRKELFRAYMLRDISHENEEDDAIVAEDLAELDKDIISSLKTAMRSGSCCDLVDFYLASKYLHGISRNGNRQAINSEFGNEMMLALAQVGNKYATRFVRSIKKYMH